MTGRGRRRVLLGLGGLAATGLLLCALLGRAGYRALDAALNPRPHADEALRGYLTAVQAGDWAAASARVNGGTPWAAPAGLRAAWAGCTAAHGPLAAFRVRSRPLDVGHATAAIRFADGTATTWSPYLTPKQGPGWRLFEALPPGCAAPP